MKKFNDIYYASLEISQKLAAYMVGIVPAYLAANQLGEITGVHNFGMKLIGAILIELVGVAAVQSAINALIEHFGNRLPTWIPVAGGAVYIGNIFCLTVLGHVLQGNWKYITVGLLSLMPAIGYMSLSVKARSDEERKQELHQQERNEHWEDKRQQIELDKLRKQAEIELERQRAEIELAREKLTLAHDFKLKKLSNKGVQSVQKSVQVDTDLDTNTVGQDSTERKKLILGHISDNGFTSVRKISSDTRIPKSTVASELPKLVESGSLYRIENDGKVEYELNGYHE